ncbi:unnamed protein product [Dicrocoelium dendriticum]|nr:unnamed protein product [Dicrocoelium dendriticum]
MRNCIFTGFGDLSHSISYCTWILLQHYLNDYLGTWPFVSKRPMNTGDSQILYSRPTYQACSMNQGTWKSLLQKSLIGFNVVRFFAQFFLTPTRD